MGWALRGLAPVVGAPQDTAGPLVVFTVGGDGGVIGRVAPMRVRFMELHSQRAPRVDWGGLRWEDPSADLTHTDIVPWTTLGNVSPQWAIALAVPNCWYELWKTTPQRNHGVAWLGDPLSGSWASVIPGDTEDRYDVRQYGPRRLWDEASAAYQWWLDQGEPGLDRWRFTISRDRQSADLLV